MSPILKGHIISGLKHASKKRFLECKAIFEKRGIFFPPFVMGTVNIELEEPFEPPTTDCVRLHVPRSEMVGQAESWDLIPVSHINGIACEAYVYRTSTNYHGSGVAELIAHDLDDSAKEGKSIALKLPHSIFGLRSEEESSKIITYYLEQ